MGIVRRLRLVFGQEETSPARSEGAAGRTALPTVEFTAYAGDSRASGWISLDGNRLTDMLNASDEVELVDALVESHEDGHSIDARELLIGRDELYVVQVAGPRGDPGRRIRTRPHSVALQVGPYTVSGYLHTMPGADPIASFRHRRAPMVPLTDASIEYQSADGRQRVRAETVVVNRNLTEWIALAADENLIFPDFVQAPKEGGLVKDFTGNLRG